MPDEPLLLTNGTIWTGTSFVRSILTGGGRIVSLDAPASHDARVIDLGGRLVVPGFIDNHLHFGLGSLQLERLQLLEATTVEAFTQRVAERARILGPGNWVLGGGWDEQQWTPPFPPSRRDLDAVAAENPVFVTRLDLHMGVASSLALRLAGITRETPDPPGGAIVRDGQGEPTGLLKDTAIRLVRAVIPPVAATERLSALRRGLREAARLGVTSFCDMGMSAEAFDDFRAWQRLDREDELTARVFQYFPIGDWEKLAAAGIEKGFGSARLRIAGLKAFADGSLGSSTAAFREPYQGEPHNRGLLMEPMLDGSMERWIAGADGHNLQLAIHAIGDDANDRVLALLERRSDPRARRFRIEHAQHLSEDLVRRLAGAGVIAAAQPYHAADDGRWAEGRIGAERAAWAFPFRSLLDAKAVVTFGSDWPVAPLSPIAGMHAAVTRRTIDGRHPGGWIPRQKITVTEALRCYTASNAWALFAERELGMLAPGMRADLAVLSRNLFTIPPEEIEHVAVEMTIAGGRIVYEGTPSPPS